MIVKPSTLLPKLIPGVYAARDAEVGGQPLARLLTVVGTELDALDAAIRQLDDDHFVERASTAALQLIAELLDAQILTADPRTWRGIVARTVHWRRHKGTVPTLEELLSISSGWDVEVDEAYRSLYATQDLNDLVLWRARTVAVWDPISLGDPLNRRSVDITKPRGPQPSADLLGVEPGETIDQALRRLGRADFARSPSSPRTLDLLGWARPTVALIRNASFTPCELRTVEVVHALDPATKEPDPRRVWCDPLGYDAPLVWLKPIGPYNPGAALTKYHEPDLDPPPPGRTAAMLLTPTGLAEDGDAAEQAGALEVFVEGIPLVGPPTLLTAAESFEMAPIGPRALFQLADPTRLAPGDRYTFDLFAHRVDGDQALLETDAQAGKPPVTTFGSEAQAILNSVTPVIQVTRTAGSAQQRTAAGAWSALAVGTRQGLPRSPVAIVTAASGTLMVRLEQHIGSGELRLARVIPDGAHGWETAALTGAVTIPDNPGLAVQANGDSLLVIAPDAAKKLGVFKITALDGTPVVTRLDAGSTRQPTVRLDPSLCIYQNRLFMFGGDFGSEPASDMWSVPVAGGGWRAHPIRHRIATEDLNIEPPRDRQARVGATLLSTANGIVLVGGQTKLGELDQTVFVTVPLKPSPSDDNAASPSWQQLPSLPFTDGSPGLLTARVAAATSIEVIAWADSTQPQKLTLATGANAWVASAIDTAGSTPPASGELVYNVDKLIVAGPPPLPPSEIIYAMGGDTHLAFLPQVDLAVGEVARYDVADDGSTQLEIPPGELAPTNTRPGGDLFMRLDARSADQRRLGLPGRLSRQFYVLRQKSLGPWDKMVPDTADDVVRLDPRLGRVLLPVGAPEGPITISTRQGRAGTVGAGMMPLDRQPLSFWLEPDGPPPTPPDLRPDDPTGPPRAPVTAWVSPAKQGLTVGVRGVELPVFADAGDALANGGSPPVIGVLGAPRLPPVRLAEGLENGMSLYASDPGSVPVISADDRGLAMALYPPFGGTSATELWLAGLTLAGRLELVLAAGQCDIRWCSLGVPPPPADPTGPAPPVSLGLWLPGGGHEDAITRRTLPNFEVDLRLYGCMVGAIQLPPWVRLTAAGCSFDAGSRDATAIDAGGAWVRLRQCTVHGRTAAGRLDASSSAFAGEVSVDRTDLGWMRYCLSPAGTTRPIQHLSLDHTVSFESIRSTDPGYLVLAANNGHVALHAGELGRIPGSYGERTDRERELKLRTDDHLPIGMVAFHVDRTAEDLAHESHR